ncbi:MAG: FtsX-like permease family protein [Alphaproteobacteria bacterium]|nr:FtsX-like permease family protein [Alphaproteobacteria bacterium]
MSRPSYITRKQELPLKGDSTSLFLQVIIAIAVFIFAITLSGVLAINSILDNWNQSILGSLTVQIMPVNDVNPEKAAAETLAYQDKAIEFLQSVDGVIKVSALKDEQLKSLIQPWLGDGINIGKLPLPRIIDVKIDRDADIDFSKLAQDLAEASPQASLDNHKLWLSKLIAFADGLKMIATTVLLLVVGISAGAIFYTTQMSLGLHKNIIEILHVMGAKDAYVAQQYARRMAFLGLSGGAWGILFAIPMIFFIGSLAIQIEGGIISDANLSILDWIVIMLLPACAMGISMWTAYYTVKRTLQKML